ncbi:hypothetical protein DVH05_024927 [Phytophthora capsici]|nr:hypothetical protein DVH05_024927 [Phytophthora capsici]
METDTPMAVDASVGAPMETDAPPVEGPVDAAGAARASFPDRRKWGSKRFPKGFNARVYYSLKRGIERKNYLVRFSQRNGYQLPKPVIPSANPEFYKKKKINAWCRLKGQDRKEYLSKTREERQEFLRNYKEKPRDEEPPPLKLTVPQNFAWPKGMNQKEFLAKKPGFERMAYLAWHIRNNDIKLEERPPPVNVPIGRQPEMRTYPRCGCSSSESCASCSRCVELHCICGLTGRHRRAVCSESRACSCLLTDPTARCKLCHGCRQPHGFFSHCRCVLHQQILWTKRHPELEVKLTAQEEETLCSCFMLENGHEGEATNEKEAKARHEMERVRRIRRAAGFPSCDSIYRSNKITATLGDEGIESEFDDGVDNGPGSHVLPPSTDSVIPRTMIRRMVNTANVTFPASYHPLLRSEGCSLLETIEPRGGRISRRNNAAMKSDAIRNEIIRGLENISYEIDRNAAMPPDDLLDFLVYMASVKAANVGELIGTFEDSAAVAASIVMEEYMAQIVEDTMVQQQPLCPLTEASVQAFSRELLVGFNWQLFDRQHPFSPSDPTNKFLSVVEKESMLMDKLSDLILREFVSTQPTHFDVVTHAKDLLRWIRSVIVVPPFILTGRIESPPRIGMPKSTVDQTSSSPRNENPSKKRRLKKKQPISKRKNQPNNEVGVAPSTPQIRLAVKANPKHGNPTYKIHFSTTIKNELHVEASVGGIDSKMKAMATVSHLAKVVEQHELGRKEAVPEFPGPPPTISTIPAEDPNDPYREMFTFLCGSVNDYKKRRWEALMDKYLSATMPGWKPLSKNQQRSVHTINEAEVQDKMDVSESKWNSYQVSGTPM